MGPFQFETSPGSKWGTSQAQRHPFDVRSPSEPSDLSEAPSATAASSLLGLPGPLKSVSGRCAHLTAGPGLLLAPKVPGGRGLGGAMGCLSQQTLPEVGVAPDPTLAGGGGSDPLPWHRGGRSANQNPAPVPSPASDAGQFRSMCNSCGRGLGWGASGIFSLCTPNSGWSPRPGTCWGEEQHLPKLGRIPFRASQRSCPVQRLKIWAGWTRPLANPMGSAGTGPDRGRAQFLERVPKLGAKKSSFQTVQENYYYYARNQFLIQNLPWVARFQSISAHSWPIFAPLEAKKSIGTEPPFGRVQIRR